MITRDRGSAGRRLRHSPVTIRAMNLQKSINRITELFGMFRFRIEAANQADLYDVSKLAEDVMIPVLRSAYNCQFLRNLNREKRDFAGLDLGDDNARIAFQITSDPSIAKIKDALQKIVAHKHYLRYETIYIYVLKQKQNKYSKKPLQEITKGFFHFDPDEHIIDSRNIIARIRNFDYEVIQSIEQTLEVHFANPAKYFLRGQAPKRTETLTVNLMPIEIPSQLFMGKANYDRNEVIEQSRENQFFVSRRSSDRAIVWAALKLKGLSFSSDWVVRSGSIITFHNLKDETLALSALVEPGTADPIPWRTYITKANQELDVDHLNIVKELLRTTLQAQLRHRRIIWQHQERLFNFIDPERNASEKRKEIRKEAWSRGRKDGRIVYRVHRWEDDPERIKFHEHLAFEASFDLYDSQWFMAIKPDWFCSYDGYKKSRLHKGRVSFLKRNEHNSDVLESLLFITEILQKDQKKPLLKDVRLPPIALGDLVTLPDSPSIDDAEWLQQDEKRKRRALDAKAKLSLF